MFSVEIFLCQSPSSLISSINTNWCSKKPLALSTASVGVITEQLSLLKACCTIEKNVFLPTIRSRLLVKELEYEEEKIEIDLDLGRLELSDIYDFVQKNSRIKKNVLKNLMQTIITDAILKYELDFKAKELEHFEKLLQLSDLNSRPTNILTSLLLTILLVIKREQL